MGTSQSSVGPNGRSPLLPAWVDDSQATTQTPDPQRLKELRQAIGRAVRGGGRDDVRKALGHYARKASGGKHTAVQKLGKLPKQVRIYLVFFQAASSNNIRLIYIV